MRSKEKETLLKRERDIVLAAIDYEDEDFRMHIKFDGAERPDSGHSRYLKQEVETCYKEGNLKKLQKIFSYIKASARMSGETWFGPYIKEKTGFDINIFENLQQQVNKILQQQIIRTENEYHDAIAMTSLWRRAPGDKMHMDELSKLCDSYSKKIANRKPSGRNNVVATTIWFQNVSVFDSPDNRRRLILAENDADINNPLTQISIRFDHTDRKIALGTIYIACGINLHIKPHWKDNNTVLIETKKEYPVALKYRQVESYHDLVTIEYIE